MAGIWVSVGSLIAAGRHGQRSPQQLMRNAAPWILKVRSDVAARGPGLHWAPSPARPGGGQCRGERPGGFRAIPAAAIHRPPGANSLSLRSSRWSWAEQAPLAATGTPEIVECRGAQGASRHVSALSSGVADRPLAVLCQHFLCT